jgi:hypothetical protein
MYARIVLGNTSGHVGVDQHPMTRPRGRVWSCKTLSGRNSLTDSGAVILLMARCLIGFSTMLEISV